jgi:RNHCP domain
MKEHASSFGDFKCAHCRNPVSALHLLSGVNNRNHCPYCLWSCHLDLFTAGDRLSACKGQMKPIGLTMKKSRNKYRLEARGELMLIHECEACNTLSINRIAADDDTESILSVFQDSLLHSHHTHELCARQGVSILGAEAFGMVHIQLYGQTIGNLV